MRKILAAAVCAMALYGCAASNAQQAGPAPAQAGQQAPMTSAVPIPGVLMVRVYSSDIARTQRFYTELFGMRATPQNPTEVSMAFPSGNVGVIINQQRDGHEMRSGFIARVADVADTLSRTEAAGGRVLRPAMTVPQMHLSVGVIADPDGTEIELIQLGG